MSLRRHKALILEDHAPTAALIAAFVVSLGHEYRIVTTLEEFLEAIAAESYCYALVDKQVPAIPGDPPLTSSGDTAMRELRKLDPRRSAADCHVTPIFVVTGADLHHKFVGDQFKLGADAFIGKPLSEQRPEDVVAVILDGLQRAGRADHADCAGLAAPRVAPASAPAADGATSGGVRFAFGGDRIGKRSVFLVSGKRCDLQDKFFAVLLRFAATRLREALAYATSHELGFDTFLQAPSRIRKACASAVPEGFDIIENVRHHGFRLHPLVVVEPIDWTVFEMHPDPVVQRIAMLERKRVR